MSLEQVGEQVDCILPRHAVLAVHKDVEKQLKYLCNVPRTQQLATQNFSHCHFTFNVP